jgi:hypothetical protein
MTMLTDGIKSQNLEEQIEQLDVAELLLRACAEKVEQPTLPVLAPEPVLETAAAAPA